MSELYSQNHLRSKRCLHYKDAKVEDGVLADVAPSILHILGMPQPADMTGKDLIK